MLAAASALFLAACGGGGGGDSVPVAPTNPPTAAASADQTSVLAGATVTLDGTASTTPNVGTLTYLWTIEKKPQGSVASLSDATAAKPTFTPDLPGEYVITLVVNDGTASSSTAAVTLAVSNPNPVAIPALVEINQLMGTTVQLDGTPSQPPAGGSAAGLSYSWTLTQKPEGSAAELDNPHHVQPRFVADKDGTYKASLVVYHGAKTSAPAEVIIKIGALNAIPQADIVADVENAVRGERIELDGSGSSDADGDALTYRWLVTSKPIGSEATLENANKAKASFTPDFAGTYSIGLTVFDGKASGGKQLNIKVIKPEGAPNTKPVARITAPWSKTWEAERGDSINMTAAYSYDIDGDSLYTGREFTLLRAPEGYDAAANFKAQTFVGTHYGDYEVRLRVFDGTDWSDPVTATYTVINGANRPPQAAASVMGSSGVVGVGNTVTITAEGSSDPDGNRMTYQWTLLDKPDNSNVSLTGASSMNATFVPDQPGQYRFDLLVTDEHGYPSTDRISVTPRTLVVNAKSVNNAPIGRISLSGPAFTQKQPMLIGKSGNTIQYNTGTTSTRVDKWNSMLFQPNGYDPDGDPLSYLWTLSAEPAGSELAHPSDYFCAATGSNSYPGTSVIALEDWIAEGLSIRNWTCNSFSFAPTVTGRYVIDLAVSDGIDFGGPYAMEVHASSREDYPNLLLEDIRQQHGWSNADQQLVFNIAKDDDVLAVQRIFPFEGTAVSEYAGNAVIAGADIIRTGFTNGFRGDFVVRSFRLSAVGGDYTITNLKAVDADGAFTPKFVGLQDNQIIKKGDSVEFQLVWPIDRLPALGESGRVVADKRNLSWSFGIKEEPDFTFHFNPTIGVY
ncbi:PKD domain-containing protein [Corticibacter populi]|uniref:PKD domain-containing protein n=1 Tax=Corticibacter populi TaxID=1550736 RepID=UPI0013C3685E|nr:PKD domain-containing protein [Corticibacter populi]